MKKYIKLMEKQNRKKLQKKTNFGSMENVDQSTKSSTDDIN